MGTKGDRKWNGVVAGCGSARIERQSKFIDENPLPIRLGLQTKLPWQLTRIKLPLCLKQEAEWVNPLPVARRRRRKLFSPLKTRLKRRQCGCKNPRRAQTSEWGTQLCSACCASFDWPTCFQGCCLKMCFLPHDLQTLSFPDWNDIPCLLTFKIINLKKGFSTRLSLRKSHLLPIMKVTTGKNRNGQIERMEELD